MQDRMMSQKQGELQKKLAITPKTASFLIQLGYLNYHDLKDASPNMLMTRLRDIPGVTKNQAETYRRAFRRMVWLATQDDPMQQAKTCSDWTQKALKARGVWSEGYDDLTGFEVDQLLALKS
jgi:hypothetical protein